MKKPIKPTTPTGKASAPGQRQKAGEGTAKSFAPGQNRTKKGKS